MCARAHNWRSEDNVQWLVFPLYHVSPEEQTQVLSFGPSTFTPMGHYLALIPFFSNLQLYLTKLSYLSDL